jgi:hypothetical protein
VTKGFFSQQRAFYTAVTAWSRSSHTASGTPVETAPVLV